MIKKDKKIRSLTWFHVCKSGILMRLKKDEHTECPVCGAKSNKK